EIGGNAPAPGATLTLAFAEGHASGFSGCNQYRAPYTVSGSTLTFGPAISTKRACIEEALNRQEVAYLGAFQNVRSFTASGDRLVLHDANGTALLTFMRASA
ncbi:MAG TPA: META domain-containing protein, partial [Thermoanaerobaculia bacterium]|nr:META domain-containing protein [Thermoanaerobaculia bacterium]